MQTLAISGAAATSLQECAARLNDPKFFARVAGLGSTAVSARDLPKPETINRYCTWPLIMPAKARELRPQPRPGREQYRRSTPSEIARIRRLAPTMTRKQIADTVGLPYTTVVGLCIQHNIKAVDGRKRGTSSCIMS